MNRIQEKCDHDWELPCCWNNGVAHCCKCDLHVDQSGYIIDFDTKMEFIPSTIKIFRPKYPEKLKWMVRYDDD